MLEHRVTDIGRLKLKGIESAIRPTQASKKLLKFRKHGIKLFDETRRENHHSMNMRIGLRVLVVSAESICVELCVGC